MLKTEFFQKTAVRSKKGSFAGRGVSMLSGYKSINKLSAFNTLKTLLFLAASDAKINN